VTGADARRGNPPRSPFAKGGGRGICRFPGEQVLVSLRRVSFSYPTPGGGSRPALSGVTLQILPGERLVVLGASGAGKSTLAALIAGVARPSQGEIARPTAAAGSLPVLPAGYVTQNPEDSFSSPLVREEMGVVLENLERDPDEIDRAVADMLGEIGLAGHAEAHPARLSGGQKQLLAIASVLIAEPPLLVLDEPLTLLDGPGRAEVELLLARERGAGAATVFFTSEVEDVVRGDRIIVLHRGAIVWEGPPADLPQDAESLNGWGLILQSPAEERKQESAVTATAKGWREGEGLRRADRRDHGGGPQRQDPEACTCTPDLPGTPCTPGMPRSGFNPPAIEISGLHFSYDPGTPRERPVLRGVDLAVRSGELLGIVGANGSGKTTLIQHLNGLLLPQRGRVTVGGRTLEPGARLARLLHREAGLVFQFPEKQLFAETVDEDVAAGPEFAGVREEAIPGLVRAALERVGLDPDEDGPRAPFALTWGEKRLAAIAGVLVLETPILVLDEPGAGLDPAGRRRLMSLLADLARREGRTVVVVSHHLDDLFRVADRIAVLHEGRIAFSGTPAALLREQDLPLWGLA